MPSCRYTVHRPAAYTSSLRPHVLGACRNAPLPYISTLRPHALGACRKNQHCALQMPGLLLFVLKELFVSASLCAARSLLLVLVLFRPVFSVYTVACCCIYTYVGSEASVPTYIWPSCLFCLCCCMYIEACRVSAAGSQFSCLLVLKVLSLLVLKY